MPSPAEILNGSARNVLPPHDHRTRLQRLRCRPAANDRIADFLAFRHGGRRLVLFRSPPPPEIVLALQRRRVLIGLALLPGELAHIGRLDAYSYLLVTVCKGKDTPLAKAASDLCRSSWLTEADVDVIPAADKLGVETLTFEGEWA